MKACEIGIRCNDAPGHVYNQFNPMNALKLKSTHAPVKAYYETLGKFGQGRFDNEGNIRGAG